MVFVCLRQLSSSEFVAHPPPNDSPFCPNRLFLSQASHQPGYSGGTALHSRSMVQLITELPMSRGPAPRQSPPLVSAERYLSNLRRALLSLVSVVVSLGLSWSLLVSLGLSWSLLSMWRDLGETRTESRGSYYALHCYAKCTCYVMLSASCRRPSASILRRCWGSSAAVEPRRNLAAPVEIGRSASERPIGFAGSGDPKCWNSRSSLSRPLEQPSLRGRSPHLSWAFTKY